LDKEYAAVKKAGLCSGDNHHVVPSNTGAYGISYLCWTLCWTNVQAGLRALGNAC